MEREEIIIDLFVRYVDDCRLFLTAINEGWRWVDSNFVFDWKWRKEDLASGETDSERTTRQLTLAMCSLVPFLKFTGEECGMFENNTLPTLDTQIWCDGERVKFSFFEKPQGINEGNSSPRIYYQIVTLARGCKKDGALLPRSRRRGEIKNSF